MSRPPIVLSALKAGISRLRIKGSANAETLYDLVNGYVSIEGTVESRPGTSIDAAGLAGTKGLTSYRGGLVVFADSPKTVPAGYTCEILVHPSDSTLTLREIHFADPYMGVLYVAAEWSNGDVFHYWLQRADGWQGETVYPALGLVQPTVPNGYTFRANRLGDQGPVWQAGAERVVGAVVEPTTFNGFDYEVIEALGAPPRSGTTEPIWPKVEGAIVVEEADVDIAPPPPQQPPPPYTPPPRYGNPGGSGPSGPTTPVGTQMEQ